MNKEQFTLMFAAVLVVCLLVTGYVAFTATDRQVAPPPVSDEYRTAVLSPVTTAAQQIATENTIASLPLPKSSITTDEAYATKVAEACQEHIADWQSLHLSAGQRVYLANGASVVLRKGTANCIESASIGLTALAQGETLAQGNPLAVGTLYRATVSAVGFRAVTGCTVILAGDYSLA